MTRNILRYYSIYRFVDTSNVAGAQQDVHSCFSSPPLPSPLRPPCSICSTRNAARNAPCYAFIVELGVILSRGLRREPAWQTTLSPLYTRNSLARDATFVPNPPDPRWLDALAILVDPPKPDPPLELGYDSDEQSPRNLIIGDTVPRGLLAGSWNLDGTYLWPSSFEDSDCLSRESADGSLQNLRSEAVLYEAIPYKRIARKLQNRNPNQNLSAYD
jgi:hypothetical protein